MIIRPRSYLSDRFKWKPFKWDVQRNDQYSGSGDGRVWQAQLAPPLWRATVEHRRMLNTEAEQMDAAIRALRGAEQAFLLASPLFCGPKRDPAGTIHGDRLVTISSISSSRDVISLSGLPGGYRLTMGDKLSVRYWVSPDLYYFGEISADVTASGGGVASSVQVFPRLPSGVVPANPVVLIKPVCKVIIVPGSYKVGTVDGRFTAGGKFDVIQKK